MPNYFKLKMIFWKGIVTEGDGWGEFHDGRLLSKFGIPKANSQSDDVDLARFRKHYEVIVIAISKLAIIQRANWDVKGFKVAADLTRSTARVYGALTALGDGSTDLLERLLPFFEPILRPSQGNRFDAESFAREVRESYRWNFNTDVVEVFVPRLVGAGWLTPDQPAAEVTNYTITLPDQILNVELEATAESELRAVSEQFQTFAQELSPLTSIPRTVEEFEDILIEWLLYIEAYSEKNIEFSTRTEKAPSGTLRQVVEIPRTTNLKDEERFLCARFVEHAVNRDPKAAETLSRIASIGLLTEVVQDFVKPVTPVETSNLVVYLDAPVAMELLGVSGKAARENTEPVVAELKRIGANVRTYGQSIDEIKHNLAAVLKSVRPTGPTAQAIARGDVMREFVAQVAADPETYLEAEGIGTTYRTLDQTPSEHAYFTEDHRTEIYGALNFQHKPHAREHDATVTTLIMRQRRGHENRDIFKSRFLLMTRNGLLAQLVRRKCGEMGLLSPSSIPPVVHRRVLTASMWLRTGLGAKDLEVPKRLLLANCERVLAIRPSVVDAVKKLTDELGDEEKTRQLDLLVSQHRSTQMLMDKTLGAPGVPTKENLGELFEQMLHPHIEKERKQRDEAVRKEKEKGKSRVEKARGELKKAQAAKDAAAKQLNERQAEDLETMEALCRDVERSLKKRRRNRGLFGGALTLLFCSPPLLGPSAWQNYLSFVLALPLGYWTITGNKLIGTHTTEDYAKTLLSKTARERGLTTKASRFEVTWKGNSFQISPIKDTDKLI
ncbi:hypothetical protein [uncultured Nitratireductor sp.]|uniref:hypothetical protein n=1 Tax=uncultured Nitratireductor sp. TaxID=520953 RepID=UPI0025DAC994|nr:hypothetical protein [uncultured Nitratireductor sp.]